MSEFGKGLVYCLGLFLCHSERDYLITEQDKEKGIINTPHMWFYAAADHINELTIPQTISPKLRKRLIQFQHKVMHWRLPFGTRKNATEEDRQWAIQEAKDLLRLIDNHFGVKTQKGDWE